jgi:hypothetical protein
MKRMKRIFRTDKLWLAAHLLSSGARFVALEIDQNGGTRFSLASTPGNCDDIHKEAQRLFNAYHSRRPNKLINDISYSVDQLLWLIKQGGCYE